MTRYKDEGVLDLTFAASGKYYYRSTDANPVVTTYDTLYLPTNQILVAGSTSSNKGVSRFNISDALDVKESTRKTTSLSIYPNPTTDFLNIMLNSELDPIVGYSIYDIQGKCLKKESSNPNLSNPKIDVSTLTKGNYLLKIQTLTAVFENKIIKELELRIKLI